MRIHCDELDIDPQVPRAHLRRVGRYVSRVLISDDKGGARGVRREKKLRKCAKSRSRGDRARWTFAASASVTSRVMRDFSRISVLGQDALYALPGELAALSNCYKTKHCY